MYYILGMEDGKIRYTACETNLNKDLAIEQANWLNRRKRRQEMNDLTANVSYFVVHESELSDFGLEP